jgi:hypothetical protein
MMYLRHSINEVNGLHVTLVRPTQADSCISQLVCTCQHAGACKVTDFIVDGVGRLSSSIELELPFAGPAARL